MPGEPGFNKPPSDSDRISDEAAQEGLDALSAHDPKTVPVDDDKIAQQKILNEWKQSPQK